MSSPNTKRSLQALQAKGYVWITEVGDLIAQGKLIEAGQKKNEGFSLFDELGRIQNSMLFICPTTTQPTKELPTLSFKFDGHGENAPVNKSQVYFVENLNASGAGSLLSAPANSYVIFNGLAGDISLPDASIRNISDNLWAMGQTGNVQIRHAAGTQNVQPLWAICTQGGIYQYLRFRPGDSLGPNQNAHGPFSVLGTSLPNSAYQNGEDNVFDHCSLQFGDDDLGETWYGSKNLTISDTIFSHPLDLTNPEYGPNFGGGSSNLTIVRCLEVGTFGRSPLLQNFMNADICNNVLWGGDVMTTLQSIGTGSSSANIVSNVTLTGNNGFTASGAIIRNDGSGINTYFDSDNWALDSSGADPALSAVGSYTPVVPRGPSSPLAAPQGTALASPLPCPTFAKLDPRNGLVAHVLNYAGASHSRDSLDAQAVNWVRNQTDTPLGVTTTGGYGGHPTLSPLPASTAVAALGIGVTDIWDKTQVDGIKASVKECFGLDPNSNTTQTFTNGGTSNDFLAIFSQFYPL